ncbi:hypothetical protein Glove_136g6 [Diversispora epigaea]|uniref:Uncharacterized protein n=1 Tax=Diversispora epigaea TaxID=1348612 RepID=A0A397IWP7_9GLOM|nr:hypothetical protein Glove_136g6 [Diversispora epigaea]
MSTLPLLTTEKYDEIFRIVVSPLRESSEECAIQLHHYTPQDEIDKEIFCLFANKKSNPKELFEALQEIEYNSNVESADEVYELLSQEVSRLQELNVKCVKCANI